MFSVILFFTVIFLFICNLFQIKTFLSALLHAKQKITIIRDTWISGVIKKKTGIILKRIIIFEDKKPYGMMPGIPLKPEMILSRGLYQKFNKDELEWVILHEVGHCVLWHVVKIGVIQLIFLIIGLSIITTLHISFLFSFIFAFLMSILAIQTIRHLVEYEADKFSIDKVTNPRGVITAQDKLRKSYKNSIYNSEKGLTRFLFHWNIYPSERIKMANVRLTVTVKMI